MQNTNKERVTPANIDYEMSTRLFCVEKYFLMSDINLVTCGGWSRKTIVLGGGVYLLIGA